MTTLLKTVRKTYDQSTRNGGKNVGPTADNSSRIALMKQVQVRSSYYDQKNNEANQFARLWGLNNLKNKTGTGGDSGIRTKFLAIFPRMSFN